MLKKKMDSINTQGKQKQQIPTTERLESGRMFGMELSMIHPGAQQCWELISADAGARFMNQFIILALGCAEMWIHIAT